MVLALFACSEYSVKRTPPGVVAPDHTGVTETGTPPVEHTGTPPTETGTPPTDTGEPPAAEAPVYANTTSELFEIEPATGARTSVGSFRLNGAPIDAMVDIAIDLNGRMYGGTYDALYRIDPRNASLTKICDTDLRPYALAFTSNGALFAGAAEDIVRVDLSDCSTSPLVTSTAYTTSGDLVGLPDGWLYWTVRGDTDDELVRVDPDDGRTQWVGEITAARLFGLGYDDGELYGFSADGEIVAIDPANGSTTQLVADGTSWWGATTNPVVW